jgi:hypothetical protein
MPGHLHPEGPILVRMPRWLRLHEKGGKVLVPMSSQVITPNTEAAILARIIQSDEQELTPEVARYLLSMKLPSGDEDRVNELSAKARGGSLTEAETQELGGESGSAKPSHCRPIDSGNSHLLVASVRRGDESRPKRSFREGQSSGPHPSLGQRPR